MHASQMLLKFILASRLELIQLLTATPGEREDWIHAVLDLFDAATHQGLLACLERVHNKQGAGNPYQCSPEGLPTGEYEIRQVSL